MRSNHHVHIYNKNSLSWTISLANAKLISAIETLSVDRFSSLYCCCFVFVFKYFAGVFLCFLCVFFVCVLCFFVLIFVVVFFLFFFCFFCFLSVCCYFCSVFFLSYRQADKIHIIRRKSLHISLCKVAGRFWRHFSRL